eukprot:307572-Rhodomonas_salina.1
MLLRQGQYTTQHLLGPETHLVLLSGRACHVQPGPFPGRACTCIPTGETTTHLLACCGESRMGSSRQCLRGEDD